MFHDEFPTITDINQVREAIKDRPEFVESERDDYIVFNYLVAHTDSFDCPIRRECRGIVFDKNGKVISRRFHKFFNLGEKPETQISRIDWTKPHIILNKLDGSMTSPLLLSDQVKWATKMGVTDIGLMAGNFVKKNIRYEEFARNFIPEFTPIFEYIGPNNRIVVRYSEENLILLAMRHTVEGYYVRYDKLRKYADDFRIPLVDAIDLKSLLQ